MTRADFVFFYHPHTYETVPSAQIGLGMLAIATHAKALGAAVRVINAQAETVESAIQMIPPCEHLCFYGCLLDADIINRIAHVAKARDLARTVLVGGPLGQSPQYLSEDHIDVVVDGPGEDYVGNLVRQRVTAPRNVFGTLHLHRAPALSDISGYPFPDRSLVEGSLGGKIFIGSGDDEQSTTILMSRGCRYRCAFCSSGASACAPLDYDLDRIERELDHCLSLGIRNVRVSDDNIMNDPHRLERICALFRDRGIRWRGSLRVKPSAIWMYRLMVESGCQELSFGIESGDQHVLAVLRKGTKVADNTAAVRNAKAAGVPIVRSLMMMGTPGETPATLALNKQWVAEAAPDIVSLKIFVPYPGTSIFEEPARYRCELLATGDYNNSSYRPDDSLPAANIRLPGVMTEHDLTAHFLDMRAWLEQRGVENRG